MDKMEDLYNLRFCGLCNNLLYPKVDKVHKELRYACRSCEYEEDTTNPCVYRNDLIIAAKENAGVTQDIGTDPTLPRSNIECPRCHNHEAVFFQNQSKRTETKMTLFYVCVHCNKSFQDPILKRRRQYGQEQEAMEEDAAMAGTS